MYNHLVWKYDKNSFLAGISVGRTLKGWAAGSDGFSGGGGDGGIYVGNFLAYPQFAGYDIVQVIETGTFEVDTWA